MAKKQVVAIIDDDESIRAATSRLVRSLGWDAHTYDSAQAFLDTGGASLVQCILSDVQMPRTSGLELLRILNAQGSRVPVVFITAFCTEAIRREALRAGAQACLSKPVDEAAVQRFLDDVASGRLPAVPPAATE
ncbi:MULTISPECIES: response regulator transcription factor [unclassified Cupriavidus]|uniref:response regulator transcription factor n=1 Tax=unclassified Cupriavidus TaxID=2640874 RepID=UPI0028BAE45F|nr:response regulator [Cupriavidus sp. SZY C1]MDT6964581.1 response regulator [Cupriavidus sp. SZY C1]